MSSLYIIIIPEEGVDVCCYFDVFTPSQFNFVIFLCPSIKLTVILTMLVNFKDIK
jgi:hypothetical protein